MSYPRMQIAYLNNEGSARIEAGDLEGGIECFRTALSGAKRLIRDEQQCQVDPSLVSCSLDQLIEFKMRSKPDDSLCLVRPAEIQISSRALYESGNATMIAMVVIFNMGVAMHIAATKDSSPDVEELQKAIHLYDCTLNLQNTQKRRVCTFEGATAFRLALLHNLAHAHSVLGDKMKADMLYKELLSGLMYVVQNQEIASSSDAEYIECFFGSTFHLMFPGSSHAASAA